MFPFIDFLLHFVSIVTFFSVYNFIFPKFTLLLFRPHFHLNISAVHFPLIPNMLPWCLLILSRVLLIWKWRGTDRGKRKMPGRDELSVAKDGPTDIEDYLKQHRFWLLQTDITGQSANCPWKRARCFCFLVSWKVDPMHLSQ